MLSHQPVFGGLRRFLRTYPRIHLPADVPTRYIARCPGALKIESARDAVNVQHFTREKQARLACAFERLRMEATQCHPATGHKLVFKCAFTHHVKLTVR